MDAIDERYMHRALELARGGAGMVSPNPMVGAVIVEPGGRVIGEGFHRRFGGPHAEVNAVNSVKKEDEHLLPESTIYVTLEPCSHFGKTPPCALLLREKNFRRVIVGCGDPNPKVAGRGINMLREAGIEVVENVMEKECRMLNIRFFTAHILKRPWIMLKWAQSADGFIARADGTPVSVSTAATRVLMHRERSLADAILVGTDTIIKDDPSLDNRLWGGASPRPVIFSSRRLDDKRFKIFRRNPVILDSRLELKENMEKLYSDYGITSLMVEGGSRMLDSFLKRGLFDRIRVETSALQLKEGIPAPHLIK
ncbi:MAG: bifunctional diaminohydroxyphosphoribosylaminopyrimidine deaminase/5-amino-6-(5-phosphoribosylamino)uracil reductase RibD [Candidatus Amulumruptor caecigallinarius]|nr:bifunctional diaminohydroxyphosphoribosylaminopyrimidine deaminase/5-amino-6-(5-phosphoribosylamino)uracil reductase RibD [Candidatus Amulumruptor caecigallinarius]